mmetsp:Transcript_8115/g.26732  ORF Transcript_8115/g.26732 Transcript_8115/m.26732 type:complete len:275 (+) Transcript_8115:1003-1827(+)
MEMEAWQSFRHVAANSAHANEGTEAPGWRSSSWRSAAAEERAWAPRQKAASDRNAARARRGSSARSSDCLRLQASPKGSASTTCSSSSAVMYAQRGPSTVAGSATMDRAAEARHTAHVTSTAASLRAFVPPLTPCGSSSSRCASSGGSARLTAPRKAVVTYASASRGGRRRRCASRYAIGHATVTHVSSWLDHHQPGASSLTRTYASTKRFGGSGWVAYAAWCRAKKRRMRRHVETSAASEYGAASSSAGFRRHASRHGHCQLTQPSEPRKAEK